MTRHTALSYFSLIIHLFIQKQTCSLNVLFISPWNPDRFSQLNWEVFLWAYPIRAKFNFLILVALMVCQSSHSNLSLAECWSHIHLPFLASCFIL